MLDSHTLQQLDLHVSWLHTAISFQFQQIPVPASDISQFRSRGSTHRSWLRASGLGAPIVVKLQLHFHVRQHFIYLRANGQPYGTTNCLFVAGHKVSNIPHPLILCMKKGTGSFGSRLFKPESKDSIFKEAECPMGHREPQYKLAVEVQIYSRYLSANWETCFVNHSSSMSHNKVFSHDLCIYTWEQPRT